MSNYANVSRLKKHETKHVVEVENYIPVSRLREILKDIPDYATFDMTYSTVGYYDSVEVSGTFEWWAPETDEEKKARKLAEEKEAIQRRMEYDEKERREFDLYAKLKKKYEGG